MRLRALPLRTRRCSRTRFQGKPMSTLAHPVADFSSSFPDRVGHFMLCHRVAGPPGPRAEHGGNALRALRGTLSLCPPPPAPAWTNACGAGIGWGMSSGALRSCVLCWRDVFVATQRGEASSTNLSCCVGPCRRWDGAQHRARLGCARLIPDGRSQWDETNLARMVRFVAALLMHHTPMSAGDQKGGGALPVLGVRPAPREDGGSCADRTLSYWWCAASRVLLHKISSGGNALWSCWL